MIRLILTYVLRTLRAMWPIRPPRGPSSVPFPEWCLQSTPGKAHSFPQFFFDRRPWPRQPGPPAFACSSRCAVQGLFAGFLKTGPIQFHLLLARSMISLWLYLFLIHLFLTITSNRIRRIIVRHLRTNTLSFLAIWRFSSILQHGGGLA